MPADRFTGRTVTGDHRPPTPYNEPVLEYAPGSHERAELKAKLAEMKDEVVEIPAIIGGEDVFTGDVAEVTMPHDHGHVIARYHKVGAEEAQRAIDTALEARAEWASWNWQDRAAVFLRAADLLAGPWRQTLNAATMLGQSKTCHQAEIDAACELIDFWRFNAHYARRIYAEQPQSSPGMWNMMDYRPLEGFIYAISPFNFTSIGGNLCSAPALMGNVAIWKPAHTSLLSSYYNMRLLQAAGLPAGVINFTPADARQLSGVLMPSPHLAGIHFTGSTGTFQHLWKQVADNLETYRTYPRLVGETGGKDFVLAHESANPEQVATALVRGAFEYQGQKCSAASRAYVPDSLWPAVRETMEAQLDEIEMGDPTDFGNFLGAVIDEPAFRSITAYIDEAKTSPDADVIIGGEYSEEKGWFVEPTVILAKDPKFTTMCEEIFGPVLTIHVYPAAEWSETIRLVDETSPYALTGAVFADDRGAVRDALAGLRNAAGNFYINDKPTGAVVGQQPFGGARASGTNDKAGSYLNLLRWVSPRTIKERFDPPTDYRYPFLGSDRKLDELKDELREKFGDRAGDIREQLGELGGSLKEQLARALEKADQPAPEEV
ncbi:MAG: L-glutamate gamma-semialdehyde dehydrogenase [Gemmatimonadales bacterium]|jgi:1-pyrroline-5-carboxylate dehydrogenase